MQQLIDKLVINIPDCY